MVIRTTTAADLQQLLALHRTAFGGKEGSSVAKLVADLLVDPSALPLTSLVAEKGERMVGHVLFTRAEVAGREGVSAMILAPLAVLPAFQGQGIGGKLIGKGLEVLRESGVQLVFVLGHPGYYPRYGFTPAGRQGLDAPYPIEEKNAGAWMVQELVPGILGAVQGTVCCAAAMAHPEYWRE